ncbi:bifunctional phosphopantothenoylcysteine decarboxylase/phosphopantothenate--cysteine ligase CoaBC [Candidatus Woesearchaeota archaeon]|nr:bifunctional phosphopantothenoylcysteine decarboxylase/phosphopantothenate--cysteine ligase CoaBC [Candidatus Woesearchaeota archaeon]
MGTIILGITSSIACFKAVELAQRLRKRYDVEAIMSKNAEALIGKPEIEKALGKKAHSSMFEPGFRYKDHIKTKKFPHITLGDRACLIVVAPATANLIGKLANGVADDLLTTAIIGSKAPVLVCPAMNVNMWEHPLVKANVKKLKDNGYLFVEPENGKLACGWEGIGRLADLGQIEKAIEDIFDRRNRLKGKKILVTAGATLEPIDPVRFISNRSSGKMGIAIAEAAAIQGAKVVLVRGRTDVEPAGCLAVNREIKREKSGKIGRTIGGMGGGTIKDVRVETVEEMKCAIQKNIPGCYAVFHAAAVSDFVVKHKAEGKIKSGRELALELFPATKILEHIKGWNPHVKLIGFKAEYAIPQKMLIERAFSLLNKSKADFIVANDVGKNAVFGSDSNNVFIVRNRKGKKRVLKDCGKKGEIAAHLLALIR